MMNYIWSAVMIFSIIFAMFNGSVDKVSNGLFISANNAVKFIISLLGVFCFWGGIMNVAEKSGFTNIVSKLLSPILKILFKDIDKDKELKNAISLNITANLLGLGDAATPLGIEAMKRFPKNKRDEKKATNNMIIFVVINSAAVRIIPSTVAALRLQHGSATPFDIMPATIITSVIALLVGIITAKVLEVITHE